MEFFDPKEAERLLRNVFLTEDISVALMVSEEDVNQYVCEDVIVQVQNERIENLEVVKSFKEELIQKFPQYRFSARLKSLPSIFGKMLRHRTLADVFGIKVVVSSIEECYAFKDWIFAHYKKFDFKDKIIHPKENGYQDLKLVISYPGKNGVSILVEIIIQTNQMYVDSHTLQKHSNVYPWKYHKVIRDLPAEYEYIEF